MSDLISRSKLIEEIKSLSIVLGGKQIFSDNAKDSVLRTIDEQPTAYDIDKVVEEFESNSFITVKNKEVKTKRKDIQSYISVEKEVVLLKDAIEIVKHGCVDDDVCEWELDGVYINSPHKPLVSCVTEENYRYYYCPVCGKKIKIVGE